MPINLDIKDKLVTNGADHAVRLLDSCMIKGIIDTSENSEKKRITFKNTSPFGVLVERTLADVLC